MNVRAGLCALLLFAVALPAAAQKERAVRSGASRCQLGVLDDDVFVDRIALDPTHVYYLDEDEYALYRRPRNGGTREFLASFDAVVVIDITVDDTSVYVSTVPDNIVNTVLPGTIYAIPKAGGTRRTVAEGVVAAVQLATDATHLYWVSEGTIMLLDDKVLSDGKIERIRKDGSNRETLASNLSVPLSLVLDANNVYFGELGLAEGNPSQGVRRVAKTGGTVTQLQNVYAATDIAQTAADVIFYGGVVDGNVAGFFRVPKNGGPVRTMVLDPDVLSPPHIFNDQMYYVRLQESFDDALMRLSVNGGTPQLVREIPTYNYDFEIDECGMYFGTVFGELVKGPR